MLHRHSTLTSYSDVACRLTKAAASCLTCAMLCAGQGSQAGDKEGPQGRGHGAGSHGGGHQQRCAADDHHQAGAGAAARGQHPDEPRVLTQPPHHLRHHRGHQHADAECHARQAVLCGPRRLRAVRALFSA